MLVATAVAIAAGVLAVLSLLLNLGVIRRLRELQEQFPGATPVPQLLPTRGRPVGRFRAVTLAGDPVSEADLATGSRIVTFFSADCSPCRRERDRLLRRPPVDRPLAFVIVKEKPTGEQEASDFAASIADVAEVALVPDEGEVVEAFGVRGYPTMIRVTDGELAAVAHRVVDLVIGPEALAGQPG